MEKFTRRADEEMKAAKLAGHSSGDIAHLHSEHGSEYFMLRDELDVAQHRFWCERLEKFRLEYPSRDEGAGFWEENRLIGRDVFTPAGRDWVRERIREEIRFRREGWTFWLSIFATVISILALYASWK